MIHTKTNNGVYNIFDFYRETSSNAMQLSEDEETRELSYSDVLELVRTHISENNSNELSSVLTDQDGPGLLKLLIFKALSASENLIKWSSEKIVERIYEDMAGLGILTQYVYDPKVEEININSYDHIEVVYGDRTVYLEEVFSSPTAAVDVVKKMARMGGHVLDAVTPFVDSYIGGGIRISAMIPPVIPEDKGVAASIRRQNKSTITTSQLVDYGVATPEMLKFLTLCLCHGVSIGIAGGTGSGKTTDQNYLLNEYIKYNNDWNNRIYLIEDSRELNLLSYDEAHVRPSRVIYTVTREGNNPITMRALIKESLRFDPHLIVPVEVRGEEALEAANAGHTGHTILTSLHAPDAKTAYKRLLFMCMQSDTALKAEELMDMCVSAWPIMCCKAQLRDGSRKYMEIFEATGVKDGVVQGNMLFRFYAEEEILNEHGVVTKVNGRFEEVGHISEDLYYRMRQHGAPKEDILSCFPKWKEELEKGSAAK